MDIRPFQLRVAESEVADLRARLVATRWPDAVAGRGWADGANVEYIRDLCDYWANEFDWREQEERINAMPQFVARIDDLDIHFVHIRGKAANSKPLILTHGWPSTFLEFEKLSALMGEGEFDLVIPSMPGFGFSSRPRRGGIHSAAVGDLWARLMRDVLGYHRFFAHGGDIGAHVTNRLGSEHGDCVAAIHTMAAPILDFVDTPSAAEQAWLAYAKEWHRDEYGYGHLQRTKPQSLAFALNDSPAGLAAWVVEKWHGWSDCGGDLDSVFTREEILTNVCIYWFTQTIGSSMRMYFERAQASISTSQPISTPARLFLTREKIDLCPEEYARRIYKNLDYRRAPRGGHFLATEAPDVLADDLRAYFHAMPLGPLA